MANLKTKRLWDEAWAKLSNFFFTPSTVVESPFGAGPVEITEPLTLYVETTGDDGSGNLQNRPFRTIQAAIDALGRGVTIRAPVVIQVGAGSFAGFVFDNSRYLFAGTPGLADFPEPITIQGTWVAPTLTTGTTSGTATSATTTDGARVFTDTGQSWTVNELKGKFLEIGGFSIPIVSNTATTVTVSITSAIAAGPYSIWTHATVIDSGTYSATSSAGGTSIGRICIAGAVHHLRSRGVEIKRMKIESTGLSSGNSVVTQRGGSPSVTLTECELQRTNATSVTLVSSIDAYLGIAQCVLSHPDSTNSSSVNVGSTIGISNSYFLRGQSGIVGSTAGTSTHTGTVSACTFESCGTGLSQNGNVATNIAATCRFLSCTTGIGVNLNANFGMSGSYTGLASGALFYFSGCTTCVSVRYGHVIMGSSTGTGNTTGISVSLGGCVQINAAGTLGAATELSVDGTTGTLATMRGNSPKVFPLTPNAYCSYIYE